MFNLIKMDIHRLLHSVSTWIIIIFTVLAAVFSVTMTNLDIQASQKEKTFAVPEDTSSEEWSGIQLGIYMMGKEEWINGKIELGDFVSMDIQSGLIAVLCVIFAALFANADQKNGYIKNIAGQFPRRGKLILSKFTAIAIQIFMMLFAYAAVTAISGFAFWGDKVYMQSWITLAKVLGVQYLLHLGIAVLTMFFSILTRSTAFSTTAGLLICIGVTAYLYAGINQIVSSINPSWNFDINNYVLESNLKMISTDTVSDGMLRGAVVGMVYVFIFAALAMATMKKRDVR